RGQADLYDRVAVVDYGRIGNAVDAHVLAAVPAHRFHELSLRVCFGWGSAAAASVTQAAVGRRSRWPGTLCRRYLAGFHQLLEAAQIFLHSLLGDAVEISRDGSTETAARRLIAHLYFHLGAASGRCGTEADLAVMAYGGIGARLPLDALIGHVLDDLGIP